MNIHVRPADQNDYDGVERLAEQLHRIHQQARPDLYTDTDAVYTPQHYRHLISSGYGIVAEQNGEILAYAVALLRSYNINTHRERTVLYLDAFNIDSKRDPDETGRALMDYLRTYAAERGCEAIELNVDAGSERNRDFFEKYGFTIKSLDMEYSLMDTDEEEEDRSIWEWPDIF